MPWFVNKWSMTIFARNVKDGSAVFAYQMTPFDQWDYDGINESMLSDTTRSLAELAKIRL